MQIISGAIRNPGPMDTGNLALLGNLAEQFLILGAITKEHSTFKLPL